jgi:hypothetical protein
VGSMVDQNPIDICDRSPKSTTRLIQKPSALPKLEIQLRTSESAVKSRTVGERIELRHSEGRSRFKKWRRYRIQKELSSPLLATQLSHASGQKLVSTAMAASVELGPDHDLCVDRRTQGEVWSDI